MNKECQVCGNPHHWAECKEPEAERIGLGYLGSTNPKAVYDLKDRRRLSNLARQRVGNPLIKVEDETY